MTGTTAANAANPGASSSSAGVREIAAYDPGCEPTKARYTCAIARSASTPSLSPAAATMVAPRRADRVEGEVALQPGESVDVAVQRRRAHAQFVGDPGESHGRDPLAIGDGRGRAHDVLVLEPALARHQLPVRIGLTCSTLALRAAFIWSNPATVCVSRLRASSGTSTPVKVSCCVNRVPAGVGASSKR